MHHAMFIYYRFPIWTMRGGRVASWTAEQSAYIITERWLSGMILDLSVPMDGKYIPTQASKAKKAAMRAARFELPVTAATPIETAAAAVMAAVLVSTFTLRDCRAPEKSEDKVRVERVGFRREEREIVNIAATSKVQCALLQYCPLTESR
jgi:hypothetical protein